MSDITPPVLENKTILKATLIAFVVAIVVAFTAVLPAEYGIDPTGVGNLLGFSKLYQPEASTTAAPATPVRILKLEDAGSKPDVVMPKEGHNPAPETQLDEREDQINVTIPAGKGLEYKVYMLKHGNMKYEWVTDEPMFFDFHGEVHEEVPSHSDFYQSYTVAYSNNMIGTFLAPFEGIHGWYFKNAGATDKVVALRLKGQYRLIKK